MFSCDAHHTKIYPNAILNIITISCDFAIVQSDLHAFDILDYDDTYTNLWWPVTHYTRIFRNMAKIIVDAGLPMLLYRPDIANGRDERKNYLPSNHINAIRGIFATLIGSYSLVLEKLLLII